MSCGGEFLRKVLFVLIVVNKNSTFVSNKFYLI